MRQYITLILTTLLLNTAQAETSDELKKDYADFRKNYLTMISSSPAKADFVKYFNDLESKLNKQFEAFLVKERRQLTPEGNQMALDLEMLEPLKILADSKLSTETCTQALHNNEMNSAADESAVKQIATLISKLCK